MPSGADRWAMQLANGRSSNSIGMPSHCGPGGCSNRLSRQMATGELIEYSRRQNWKYKNGDGAAPDMIATHTPKAAESAYARRRP